MRNIRATGGFANHQKRILSDFLRPCKYDLHAEQKPKVSDLEERGVASYSEIAASGSARWRGIHVGVHVH